jgi:hypothetical protein
MTATPEDVARLAKIRISLLPRPERARLEVAWEQVRRRLVAELDPTVVRDRYKGGHMPDLAWRMFCENPIEVDRIAREIEDGEELARWYASLRP